jgi:hypothetical protein
MMDTSTFQPARLIPITGIKGDQEQERRATSALLAVLMAVPEFARSFLKPLGAPSGRVSTFIEPEFIVEDKKVRPDGLIVIERGAKSWSAAVEVKTAKNDLKPDQINSYLDVCRDNDVNVLLTISNQVLTLSGVHPTQGIDGRKLRKVVLHHYSWMKVLTEAQIQKEHRGVSDPDQAWILNELIRYLEAPSSGALEFTDMGESWVSVRQSVNNGTLSATDKGSLAVVERYESLLRYASFKLASQLGVEVSPVTSKLAKTDPKRHMQDALARLVKNHALAGAIAIKDTIAPLEINVDLRAAQILCSVSVDAPREGRPLTRVNWLLRQLKNAPDGVRVETWVKRSQQPAAAWLLREVREQPEKLLPENGKEISAFTVTLIGKMGTARGDGNNSFVVSFMSTIHSAYQSLLQELQGWAPRAPKMPILETSLVAERHTAEPSQSFDPIIVDVNETAGEPTEGDPARPEYFSAKDSPPLE